ncbi:YraN family protein, partial [Lysobacter sp. 2RAB21]
MPRAADPAADPARSASDRRGRGAAVEAAARAYLLEHGLRAVAANANYRFGELDLVVLDADTVVFVEVRYRRDDRFGGGAVSV